jgi:acetyltransferase
MRGSKKHKNLCSARHYDQIRFRFRTAKTQSGHAAPGRRRFVDRSLCNIDQSDEVAAGIIPCRIEADMVFNEPHLLLRDGTPVLIRRLEAHDATLYPDFLSDVTAEDLRLRFFAPVREVNHALLDKLIHYDPARAMAFIAVDEQSRKMLGVVRLHDDPTGESAEFAILVRSRLKSQGVGWLLMNRIIEFSKQKSLKTVRGQVLSENTTMLAMCAELGFHIANDTDDPGVKSVTLQVERSANLVPEYS